MRNSESMESNPETTGIGKNLEVTIGNLPENALKGVRNLFLEIRDLVTQK